MMICCDIGMAHFNKIVGSGEREFKAYQSLSKQRKLEIISLFWTNLVKYVLVDRREEADWKETKKEDAESKFSHSIPNAIFLKSKEKKEEGYLAISVSYNENLCTAEINYFVIAKDKTTEEKLKRKIANALISIERFLSDKITSKTVLKYCFETLRSQKLCKVRGNDAVVMHQIMTRAIKHYPKFAELSKGDKIKKIRSGYNKAMKVSARDRDEYTFSRATLEKLERSGLVDVVYKLNPITSKYCTYERCGQSPYSLPDSPCPRFIDYLVENKSGAKYRTSILLFDLWELLATS